MAVDLGLHCLPLSHKKDVRLICVSESHVLVNLYMLTEAYMFNVDI